MLIACNSMVSGYRCVLKDSHTTLGLKNPYRVRRAAWFASFCA